MNRRPTPAFTFIIPASRPHGSQAVAALGTEAEDLVGGLDHLQIGSMTTIVLAHLLILPWESSSAGANQIPLERSVGEATMQLGLGLPDCVNAILVDARAVDALLAQLATGYEENDARDLYDLLAQVVLRRPPLAPSHACRPSVYEPHGALALEWGCVVVAKKAEAIAEVADGIGLSGTNVPFRSAEYRQMSRFVQTANAHGLPCYVTGDPTRTYEVVGAPRYENALCDALGQYSTVEQRVRVGMLRRGASYAHFVNLRIPPLPFEIIRRSRSLEDVIWHTLDVRHDYSKIRRDLAESRLAWLI